MATRDKRALTSTDVDDFERAATWRPPPKAVAAARPVPLRAGHPATVEELMRQLAKRNPMRVRRMRADLRWLEKKGRKYGIRVL